MPKIAKRYLDPAPWVIRESGFHADRALVSESNFSLANEFMGVRGYFEEGYGGECMVGAYFNGVYLRGKHTYGSKFRGFAEEYTSMVNACDWLHTRIEANGERLDLASVKFRDFVRELDMREGILRRSFVWETEGGARLRVAFSRLLSMTAPNAALQTIEFECLEGQADLTVETGVDFGTLYHSRNIRPWKVRACELSAGTITVLGQVEGSGHRIATRSRLELEGADGVEGFERERLAGHRVHGRIGKGDTLGLCKRVVHHVEKDPSVPDETVLASLDTLARGLEATGDKALAEAHAGYWRQGWDAIDVGIDGDPENEQGLRFCLFHLRQTYHGVDPANNIGAKGLTGEHYQGLAFWDTETYCLPYYLFNDRKAAGNLVRFRHVTLDKAVERAHQLDSEGARYPMCTIDGEEVCDVWQHGDIQVHLSSAVAYAVMLYEKVIGPSGFLRRGGLEMMLQIGRFYASRGGWGQVTKKWGYYGVMGPDEMHMMVNNNAYTNVMAAKSMAYAVDLAKRVKTEAPETFAEVAERVGLREEELEDWTHKAANTYVSVEEETGVIEQFAGYFDMPHLDFESIPESDFPLIKNWAYVRRLIWDLIKQPDTLLLPLFFSEDYSLDQKRANFDFYEPRCSHESSLSPCIHSILAAELGYHEKAFEYSRYAYRIDLDDYNNNTYQGLHVTSMGGAWMNLVYGFGGLRTDGSLLSFKPSLPAAWEGFRFRIYVDDERTLEVRVNKEGARFATSAGTVRIRAYDSEIEVGPDGVSVPLEA